MPPGPLHFQSATTSLRLVPPAFRTLPGTFSFFTIFTHLRTLPIETGNPNGIFGPSDSVFGPSKSPFGPEGFGGGMSFPGMPDSAASTPGGGYKNNGY